jgi:hypothetical protein
LPKEIHQLVFPIDWLLWRYMGRFSSDSEQVVFYAPVPNYFSARKNTPKKGRLISQAPFPIYVIGQMAQ